jgi:hypothetical protein
MNNFILINKTFAEVTPESSEHGDFSDSGFISQDEQVDFRELVQLMKEHLDPSSSPDPMNTNTWYSSGYYTENYKTGTDRETSIHFSRNNTPNAAKYWKWARQAANKKIKTYS